MSASKPQVPARPLSPFMLGQYYRFQLTSVLSFVHRITGIGLSLGTLLVAAWLITLASGPELYGAFQLHLTAWYGQTLLFCWTWALMYHLCNGIRHLIWDAGYALELSSAYASGYISLVASFLLTGAAWALAILV
jgi:succinate dehydrogenase / fumarate reductase, cytochrome b subunit